MTAEAWLVIIGAILNGATTWGVVSTRMAWMRRDIDDLRAWRASVEARRQEAMA